MAPGNDVVPDANAAASATASISAHPLGHGIYTGTPPGHGIYTRGSPMR